MLVTTLKILAQLSGSELGKEKQALFAKRTEDFLSCEWGSTGVRRKDEEGTWPASEQLSWDISERI